MLAEVVEIVRRLERKISDDPPLANVTSESLLQALFGKYGEGSDIRNRLNADLAGLEALQLQLADPLLSQSVNRPAQDTNRPGS
jgi:hypothetical protein